VRFYFILFLVGEGGLWSKVRVHSQLGFKLNTLNCNTLPTIEHLPILAAAIGLAFTVIGVIEHGWTPAGAIHNKTPDFQSRLISKAA
jgi:hypothetical protein